MNKDKHIPQGYKDSPLGIIPKEWEVKRLGDCTRLLTNGFVGVATPHYTDDPDGITYIQGFNVTEGGYNFSGIKKVTKEFHKKNSKSSLQDGDLLTIQTGDIGLTTIVPKELEGSNCHALIISRFKEGILPRFMLYYYNSTIGRNRFHIIETGSTMKHINTGDLYKFYVPVPPIEEQKIIIAIASLWDTAIEKQSELIEKLKLRKRALMQQLLTGKKRLPEFSGEWKKRTYSNILIEVKRSLKWDENELYKLISVRRRSEGLFFRESLYGRDIATKNLRPAKTGDFLISKMQIVHGASGLVTNEFDDAKISGSYISLVSKDSNILDIRYYNLWSQMPIFYHQTFVSSFGVHIEKMTFDLDTFMSFSMLLPPIDEQHAIVSLIESINKEIKLANEKLTNYQSQKRGLMQQLLTGKKRIIGG